MASSVSARVVDLSASHTAAAPTPRATRIALAWFAGWSVIVFAMSALVSAQKAIPLRYTLPSEALNYYTLAVISVVVWFSSARMALQRWSWRAQAAAHVALGLASIAIWQTIYGLHLRSVIGPRAWDSLLRSSWMFQMMNACVLYGGVVGGTLAIQTARRARAHERRQHEMALLARDAELRALTAQIEPHFLLNTLTSILALIDANPADARAMLERLAELLQAAFDEMQEAEVTLGRELDFISAYLDIEQVRFADRLTVVVDVPGPLRVIGIPPFLLQPLVENAVKHAVAPFTGRSTITIRGRREGPHVRLEIADSGRGFDRGDVSLRGRGLQLTERRLQAFAPDGRLLVETTAAGGCVVALTFPA